ncbi:Transport and Golgi organization protein 11 [Portunus trituberculatus]|uniref:Mitochondrial fission factor n=1 Tax=Portunus trituberculatus TaxID=210409 RepID=A0A5B7CVA6_PORTR|nr:Transport and Golgi organization protein 11 [Portunus trituberculatus]
MANSRPHTWESSSTNTSTTSSQPLSPTEGFGVPSIFYNSGFERSFDLPSLHYTLPEDYQQTRGLGTVRIYCTKHCGRDNDDDPTVNWARYNGVNEKLHMSVPDRIVVAGGDQHIGTRGVPREVELEKSIMPQPDPALYRVQTPPRSITLDSYTYPGTEDLTPSEDRESSTPGSIPTLLPRTTSSASAPFTHPTPEPGAVGIATDLSPGEEVSLLRRQVGRLNRRVMALELDSQQRSHREMVMYTLGAAYFLIKALLWLNRN